MNAICDIKDCTACGACENICPKGCIKKCTDMSGVWTMKINESECINCGLCRRVCPNNSSLQLNYPNKAYAGWSEQNEVHKNAASGGIAAELYEYAADNGFLFAGVSLNREFEAHYELTGQKDRISEFQNSKYTFSFMDDIYIQIRDALANKKKVLFIGLPCQVAALKNFLNAWGGVWNDALLTVDLVCHGTPPPTYLKQHIHAIAKDKANRCEFRDPRYGTENYIFSLYGTGLITPFYKKKVVGDDCYQIGYHSAIIYRNCCYNCIYARCERVGDLTIGDYHGLGKLDKYSHNRRAVSCILANTQKGLEVLQILSKRHVILHERPVEEPLKYEKMFNHPSIAPKERELFLMYYEKFGQFEEAAKLAFKKKILINRIKAALYIPEIKKGIRKHIPDWVVAAIKGEKKYKKE